MSDEQQSTEEQMTNAERDAWMERLHTAWRNLPPSVQGELKPTLDDGHAELAKYVQTGQAPAAHTHTTLRLKSYLTADWDGYLHQMGQPIQPSATQPLAAAVRPEALEITIGDEGEILGVGKYEQLDPRWELVAGTIWLENLLHKHPFPPGAPKVLTMNDTAQLALVSDWGTGNFGAADAPSVKIAKVIAAKAPDYSIHLGDVYYAGTSGEETSNLLALWPVGTVGSFALNSNHDMYSGGGPYFNQVVGGAPFHKLQSPWSFWAMENEHWVVVGLDSAYHSSVLGQYMDGTLGTANAQLSFLREIASKGKKVIVLTHHNPIPIEGGLGEKPLTLYNDVAAAFAGAAAPVLWYYGHVHVGAAYKPIDGTSFRCLGHGGLPWGYASALGKSSEVEWFEQRKVDPATGPRVFNGWVMLALNGASLTETFYDEDGGVAWLKVHPG